MNTTHLQSLFGSALPASRAKSEAQPREKDRGGRPRLCDGDKALKVRMSEEMFAYLQDQGGVGYVRSLVERDMQRRGK